MIKASNMKKALLSTLLVVAVVILSGQAVSDMVSLSPGLSSQTFYSMENGEVVTVDNTDWDIAFSTNMGGSSVLVNHAIGIELYNLPASISWGDQIDTTGFDSWEPLTNSTTDWDKGVFEEITDENDQFDYGWGQYDPTPGPTQHMVLGDLVCLVMFSDGSFKRLMIEDLDFGVYHFKIADFDGSNEESRMVSLIGYGSKNFIYYSIASDTVIDREPASENWDITFTRYIEEFPFVGDYLVTGVMTNYGVQSGEQYPVVIDQADWSATVFGDDISIIGQDWKYFNNMTFEYIIEDSLIFYVQDQQSAIYSIVFTGFGGSATGDIEFDIELVGSVGIADQQGFDFELYPNPTESSINMQLVESVIGEVQIFDMAGRLVQREQLFGATAYQFDVGGLYPGTYLLRFMAEGRISQERFTVR